MRRFVHGVIGLALVAVLVVFASGSSLSSVEDLGRGSLPSLEEVGEDAQSVLEGLTGGSFSTVQQFENLMGQSTTTSGSSTSDSEQPTKAAASSAPGYNAKKTQKNMLKLVHAYDADAYYILHAQDEVGDSFESWMKDSDHLADAVDTTVHEEFHSFTFTHGSSVLVGNTYASAPLYYLGKGKTRQVSPTVVFKSEEATAQIPTEYRTTRYDTYVAKGANVSANTSGVYGMLNEFCAYYWGMHAGKSLYPYLQQHVSSYNGYSSFILSYQNGRDAYAEFYYWTLVYLDYARTHEPDVYQGILNNEAYVKTFNGMSAKYRKLIESYGEDVQQVENAYPSMMRLVPTGDYEKLIGQIKSSQYSEVRKALANAA